MILSFCISTFIWYLLTLHFFLPALALTKIIPTQLVQQTTPPLPIRRGIITGRHHLHFLPSATAGTILLFLGNGSDDSTSFLNIVMPPLDFT